MSIIATVIGGVILVLRKVLRKRISPNANYMLWLVFMVALLFPIAVPSRISIYNYIDISDVKYVSNEKINTMIKLWKRIDAENDNKQNIIKSINTNNKKISRNHIKTIISFIWLAMFINQLTRKLKSYFAMNKLTGNEIVTDERVVSLFETCKKELKIKKNIKLTRQDITDMPSTIGVFNVKILISKSFLELDDTSITNVFMHELSHYKRKDNVINFMILIIKSLHWFNPLLGKMFKYMRYEMELATDEIAVSKMNVKQRVDYCQSMVRFSTSSDFDFEQMLGISNTAVTLEKRIKMISLKKDFDKNSKIILGATLSIIILMCLILYPTCYGIFQTPQLYLQLENGDEIKATNPDESTTINEIKLAPNDTINLIVKNGKAIDYIFYRKANLNTMEFSEDTVNISEGKMTYFESGEAIYKFTLKYGKNKNIDYVIKIIVE